MLCIFPKAFFKCQLRKRHFSSGNFPKAFFKWQLPEGIFQVAISQRHFPSGNFPNVKFPSLSSLQPAVPQKKALSNLWEVLTREFGTGDFGKYKGIYLCYIQCNSFKVDQALFTIVPF